MALLRTALYLLIALVVALLAGATWTATKWGVSLAALFPLFLFGLLLILALVFGASRARKIPHA